VRTYILFVLILAAPICRAIELPTGLRRDELDDVVRILGFNSSARFISNPYPLGGYSGLEIGVTLETINTEELSLLGDQNVRDDELQISRISVGKGLFNDIDVFINFVPYSRSNQINEFGGLAKWTFFEGQFLPITGSALLHFNTISIEDSFVNQSTGGDLMLGVNAEHFSLYFGAGYVRTRSQFTANILDGSVTLSPQTTFRESFSSSHSFVGVQVQFSKFFIAGHLDRYADPVYSVKLCTRLYSLRTPKVSEILILNSVLYLHLING